MVSVIKCPNCGRQNKENTQICVCGAALVDLMKQIATHNYDNTDYEAGGTSPYGSSRVTSRTNLVIGVGEEARSMSFDADMIDELIIGREDPKTGVVPDINLGPYSGLEKGVSRYHAAIVYRDGTLNIEDRGSANKTFLNGQPLVEDQPRVLRDGDLVRLGHLVISITFENTRS